MEIIPRGKGKWERFILKGRGKYETHSKDNSGIGCFINVTSGI
jgi:hypothetical protein